MRGLDPRISIRHAPSAVFEMAGTSPAMTAAETDA